MKFCVAWYFAYIEEQKVKQITGEYNYYTNGIRISALVEL